MAEEAVVAHLIAAAVVAHRTEVAAAGLLMVVVAGVGARTDAANSHHRRSLSVYGKRPA